MESQDPFKVESLDLCPYLPWFRVHILVVNDPGRLISSHLVHTGIICGWAALMLLFELIVSPFSDPVFTPIWRNSLFVVPQLTKLGVTESLQGISISGTNLSSSF